LSKIKAFREQTDNIGIKGKITRFSQNNSRAFDDREREEAARRFREELNSEQRVLNASVLKKVKRGDIKKFIDYYKAGIVGQVLAKGPEIIDTFDEKRERKGRQVETGNDDRKETPIDFGCEKGKALLRYGDYVESHFPDSNVHWFIDQFTMGTETFGSPHSYMGFSFEYHGKLCVIAESLDDEAAMYLWRGEIGEDLNDDFRQMFDMARFDAKRTDDPRIVSVGHLDKEHFDDSLDEAYQKAFMFFNSGDKREVLYKNYGGAEGWRNHRDAVLGAWPLNVEQDYVNYPEDMEKYHAWQQRQTEVRKRLTEALQRGGRAAMEEELKRIAEEDYRAMYEEGGWSL
jgi:hypothetical protein